MKVIKALCLFYVFKKHPRFIENGMFFWGRMVKALNEMRVETGDAFYLWRVGRLCARDPFSIPDKKNWTHSKFHPFCWNKSNDPVNPPEKAKEKDHA